MLSVHNSTSKISFEFHRYKNPKTRARRYREYKQVRRQIQQLKREMYESKKRSYAPGQAPWSKKKKYKPSTRSVGTQTYTAKSYTITPRVPSNLRTGGYLGLESKFIDTTVAETVILHDSWAGGEMDPAANCLCAPTQGNGESNREGRRIVVTQISLQGKVYRVNKSDQADAVGPTTVRVALVWDKQTNGAQMSAEQVYVDAGNRALQFRELEYIQRFQVMWSGTFTLTDGATFTDGANTGTIGGTQHFFDVYKKCSIIVNFSANAGSVADIVDNSFHVICCTDGVGATDYIQYQARCRFKG